MVSTRSGCSQMTSSLKSDVSAASEPKTPRAQIAPHERTTVMMRNIPNNMTRRQLLAILENEGFLGAYNLVYLPIDLKNKVGLGYAFVNCVSNDDAVKFTTHFQGFTKWNMHSEKVCEVAWSDALQGLDEHIE